MDANLHLELAFRHRWMVHVAFKRMAPNRSVPQITVVPSMDIVVRKWNIVEKDANPNLVTAGEHGHVLI